MASCSAGTAVTPSTSAFHSTIVESVKRARCGKLNQAGQSTFRTGGNWDISAFSSYGSGSSTISGIISNINTYKSRYGKPVMQVEFGGRYDRASRTETDLESYVTGMKNIGGLGVFYWEPEVYSPFTSYNMGAWDPTTREPTIALDGFLNA